MNKLFTTILEPKAPESELRDVATRAWPGSRATQRVKPWASALATDPVAITSAVTRGVSRWLEDS